MKRDDHYVIITADTHARREPSAVPRVPRSEVPRRLRRLAGEVQEPVQGPEGHRSAGPELGRRAARPAAERRRHRRRGDLPEHRAAVLPELRAVRAAADPEEYEHRHAGVQAHNRWLADFVAEKPEARAGIGQIFLNDLDDAIADVQWCKEHGLRGGVFVGSPPPTCDWLKPLYDPYYDPLWRVCEELGVAGQRAQRRRRSRRTSRRRRCRSCTSPR